MFHSIILIILIQFLIDHTNGSPYNTRDIKISSLNDSEILRSITLSSKSHEILSLMNSNIKPCDDFYEFSCGKFSSIYPVGNSVDTLSNSFFENMRKNMETEISKMFRENNSLAEDIHIDKLVRLYYKSCLNIDKLNMEEKIKNIINEFGDMPILVGDEWNEKNFDWLETISKIYHKYGHPFILALEIIPDFANNTVNRVYLSSGKFTLDTRSMYLKNTTANYRQAYANKIAKNLQTYLKVPMNIARQTAKEILEFEINLASGLVDDRLGLDYKDLAELKTLDALQEKYAPMIDVKKFFNITFGKIIKDKIYEYASQYQENLIKVIKETPKKIIANYIYWSLADQYFVNLTTENPETECLRRVKSHFATLLDNTIYRKNFKESIGKDIDNIWKSLKVTFKNMLEDNSLKWISDETRKYAIEKLDAVRLEINSYKDKNFTQEYGDLIFVEDDYIENLKNIAILVNERNLAKLDKPVESIEDPDVMSYTPANIIIENMIKIPVAMLKPYLLWSHTYPNALKFSTLGLFISHELIHAFDDMGRNYDKNGNNRDWWDKRSEDEFNKRKDCFIEQYSNYKYNNRYLPRSQSQSENIADNGGLRLAYNAYIYWLKMSKESGENLQNETLPHMNYTGEQLFFISFAQIWCNNIHVRMRTLQTEIDVHVPGEYRVNGPVSNFQKFSEQFKCLKDAPMNPTNKCRIY